MIRFLRVVLYVLAIASGMFGLVAGGKSLAKYAIARLKDPYFDSFSYNDLILSGSVIFLLSLLVLIFVDISLTLGRALRSPRPEKKESAARPAGLPAKSIDTNPPSLPEPSAESESDRESADEKLARLLKQKNE